MRGLLDILWILGLALGGWLLGLRIAAYGSFVFAGDELVEVDPAALLVAH